MTKNTAQRNSCLFRAPLGAAPVASRAKPWREFGGAAGPGGGGERAFPRPLGRRRGASSSASLAEGALGSSGVPSARSRHSSAACDTRQRRRPAAGTLGLAETRERPSCRRSNAGRSGRFRDSLDLKMGSPRRVARDPTPTRFRDLAKRPAEGSEPPSAKQAAATESQRVQPRFEFMRKKSVKQEEKIRLEEGKRKEGMEGTYSH
ncbi:uncharacterized protein LOC110337347 [Mus pahari]|uniref:uncharacterized protein LOC110337347 n=1 Tax=Mus pahari TaxID=10093 RepID=UPI001114E591|nr:uncharacterized protein LOC110337347 [Mus pahari]